jgi:glycerophosphoryl diester phosphodiesterase
MRLLLLAVAVMTALPLAAAPIVIAHRGASADRPEHTLAAYRLAIEQGADFIEPDLVPTRDGELVARHENEIGGTTDVAEHPEFADRRTTKTIDGERVTGWFTEDFTLAELKRLRARERLPQLRPANTAHDGRDTIPTLAEIIALARSAGRTVGIYPETKHPSYFRSIGLPLEERLLAVLAAGGYTKRGDPVFIQSFEVGNLRALRARTDLRLIQLVAAAGRPADATADYASMLTPEGLRAIAAYADGIGVEKSLVLPRDAAGRSLPASELVAAAHAAGLKVHAWTFRPENYFLPLELRQGEDPRGRGDAEAELRAAAAAGVDGVFSDSVAEAVRAFRSRERSARSGAQ